MAVADEQGFASFYAAAYPRLVAQLLAVTGNLQEAEDVVREAFARASVRRERLCVYQVPEAWVRRSPTTSRSAGCAERGVGWCWRHGSDRLRTSRRCHPTGSRWWRRLAGCRCGSAKCSCRTTEPVCPSIRSGGSSGSRLDR
jgi:hypothetical protein